MGQKNEKQARSSHYSKWNCRDVLLLVTGESKGETTLGVAFSLIGVEF